MMRRILPIAVGAAMVLVLASTVPAGAYPDAGSVSKCSSGDSGAACAHLETDAGSGHIRARGAATANPGFEITVTESSLWELTTERATGQQTESRVALKSGSEPSTGSTVSVIAGPAQEECDNALATFRWRAMMTYTTVKGSFTLDTGWQSGRC